MLLRLTNCRFIIIIIIIIITLSRWHHVIYDDLTPLSRGAVICA